MDDDIPGSAEYILIVMTRRRAEIIASCFSHDYATSTQQIKKSEEEAAEIAQELEYPVMDCLSHGSGG